MKLSALSFGIGLLTWVPCILAQPGWAQERKTGELPATPPAIGAPNLRADGEENAIAHVLIACDTLDKKGGLAAQIDLQLMYGLLSESISSGRRKIVVLSGDQCTRERILNHYKVLHVGKNDTVMFFYTGHGAWDLKRDDHFLAPRGERLWRKELRAAMVNAGGRLTVLLTNCCANSANPQVGTFGRDDQASGGFQGKAFSPVMGDLLFRHHGVVDITAADKGTSAYYDPKGASFFTLALHWALQCSPDQLDSDGDGFITWEELFLDVHKKTNDIFLAQISAQDRTRAGQYSQEPVYFDLGKRLNNRPSDYSAPRRPKTVATTIFNPTGNPIIYEFRWGEEGFFKWFVVPPGCYIRHLLDVPDVAKAPKPEVRYPIRGDWDWLNPPVAARHKLGFGEIGPRNSLGFFNKFQWGVDDN